MVQSPFKHEKLEKQLLFLYIVSVFVFMLVFFSNIHPIVIFDADDWTYISYSRAALPTTKFFNPCRIFPEVFMSLCGNIAAYVIYPLTGQYMRATTLVMAAAYSFFIALYTYELQRFLRRRFRLSMTARFSLTTVFLIFHFMIFRTQNSGNCYLFWSKDATCYFYYNIPILMNCMLCMRILGNDIPDFSISGEIFHKSLFIVLVYFTIFSNLFSSIISAGFIASFLIVRLVHTAARKAKFTVFLKTNIVPVMIEFMWLFSALLEMSGERAEEAYNEGGTAVSNILSNLPEAIDAFRNTLSGANRIMLLLCMLSVALAFTVALTVWLGRKRGKKRNSAAANSSHDAAHEAAQDAAKNTAQNAARKAVQDAAHEAAPGAPLAGTVTDTGAAPESLRKTPVPAPVTAAAGSRPDLAPVSLPVFVAVSLLSFVSVSVLLLLLSAASVPSYAGSASNILAPLFFLFLFVMLCLAYVMERRPGLSVFLPLLCIILMTLTNTYSSTFIESNAIFTDAKTCAAIGEDLITQYRTAEEAGLSEFELHVLDAGGGDNWPHAEYIGDRITTTLLKHGIISSQKNVTLKPDREFNRKYHIDCWD